MVLFQKISLFPRGVDSLKNTGKSPVAKLSIEKSSKVNKEEIFKALPNRQMNEANTAEIIFQRKLFLILSDYEIVQLKFNIY